MTSVSQQKFSLVTVSHILDFGVHVVDDVLQLVVDVLDFLQRGLSDGRGHACEERLFAPAGGVYCVGGEWGEWGG